MEIKKLIEKVIWVNKGRSRSFEKCDFSAKIYGFLKIFFAQKKEQKKLHRVVPTKSI